jgi:hypothetical protein
MANPIEIKITKESVDGKLNVCNDLTSFKQEIVQKVSEIKAQKTIDDANKIL